MEGRRRGEEGGKRHNHAGLRHNHAAGGGEEETVTMDAGEEASTQPSQPTDTNHPLHPNPTPRFAGTKTKCRRNVQTINRENKRYNKATLRRLPSSTHPHPSTPQPHPNPRKAIRVTKLAIVDGNHNDLLRRPIKSYRYKTIKGNPFN